MKKGWLQPNATQELYIPLDNYDQAVAASNKKLDEINKEISALKAEHDKIISGNHDVLLDKKAQIDKVIVEQHEIKQKIFDGATEASDKLAKANLMLTSLNSDRAEFDKNVEIFNRNSANKLTSLTAWENDLKAEDARLKLLKLSLDSELDDANKKLANISQQISACNDRQAFIDKANADLNNRENFIKQREDVLASNHAKYCASNAALVEAQANFACNKEALDKQSADIAAAKDDINRKIEEHNSLIIQNAKVKSDAEIKIEQLQFETQQNLQSIADLTTLKEQLIKQGALNENPTKAS